MSLLIDMYLKYGLNPHVDIREHKVNSEGVLVIFPNSYGASIIPEVNWSGHLITESIPGQWEISIMDSNGLTYETPIANDVIQRLETHEVYSILEKIGLLPAPKSRKMSKTRRIKYKKWIKLKKKPTYGWTKVEPVLKEVSAMLPFHLTMEKII